MATLGPVGYWPVGPGTLASALVALGWWAWQPSPLAWGAAVVAAVGLGVAAAGAAEPVLGHDDGRIVVDEAAGMGLALLAVPPGALAGLVAFLAFRLFDILKPPPLGRLQRLRGGVGVVADDVAAGVAAALLTVAGLRILG